MMRRATWRSTARNGGVGLAAYVLFLLMLAPASLLDSGLRRASDGRLRLAQAQGTLWSGHGQLEIRDDGGHGVGKALSWTLQPRGLLRGRLDIDVDIDHAARHIPLRIAMRRIEASDIDLTLPASTLGLAVPGIAPLGPSGELAVHVAKFSLVGDAASVDGVVTWRDAGSALTSIAPLGSYELRLGGEAGALHATLRTISGPLHLDGSGSMRGTGPAVFSAIARVDPPQRSQLAPLLRLIAVERGDGDFVLQPGQPFGNVSTHTTRPANP
jgi:general secretion pathway protein N